MQKESVLYKAMEKYRRKFLLYNVIVLVLLILFTVWRYPYIRTEISGSTPLDMERYLSETGTFDIDELIELTRHEPKQPEQYYYKDITYWQDNRYLFDIKATNVRRTDIVFTSTYTAGNEKYEYVTAEIWYAEAGGRTFAVIANPDTKYKEKLTGYLVEPSRAITSQISQKVGNGEKITLSDYFIDCRGTEMGTAASDWMIVKITAAVLLYLFLKLLLYYLKPQLTPTYRQLQRYGDIENIADEVNRQAESDEAYIEDKKLVTPDFILSDDTFKKKVVRNHMSKY